MNNSSKSALETIERCVTEGGATVRTALESAYQLGKLDGGMEMADLGRKVVEKLLVPA